MNKLKRTIAKRRRLNNIAYHGKNKDKTMNPIRVTKKQACQLLSISGEKIRTLVQNDPTFPKPYKEGATRQASVYFDYAELMNWHQQKRA